jgi:hypothetical protein
MIAFAGRLPALLRASAALRRPAATAGRFQPRLIHILAGPAWPINHQLWKENRWNEANRLELFGPKDVLNRPYSAHVLCQR